MQIMLCHTAVAESTQLTTTFRLILYATITDGIIWQKSSNLFWGLDFTVVVYISEKLRQGQIRGIEQNMEKLFGKLEELKEKIKLPTQRGRKRKKEDLDNKITSLIAIYTPDKLIGWRLQHITEDAFEVDYWIDEQQFNLLKEKWLGRRILITNRHGWSTEEIILAYWGNPEWKASLKT